jgi:hypothetical protein
MKPAAHPLKLALAGAALLAGAACVLYVAACGAWWLKLAAQRRLAPRTIESGFVRHPYLTGEHVPGQVIVEPAPKGSGASNYVWRLNAQGCRDDRDYRVGKAPGTTRWLCLGGSALVSGSGNALTIPALLASGANAARKPGAPALEVLNFGRVGWDSTQELFFLATEGRAWRPDYLLVYDGRNDAFQATLPSYRPFWNAWGREMAEELNRRSATRDLFYPLWRALGKARDLRDPRSAAERQAHQLFQERARGEWDFYRAHLEVGAAYEGNLRALLALAREWGCRGAVLALQPQIDWLGAPLTAGEARMAGRFQPSWRQAMRELYPTIRAAHRAAAEGAGLPVLEADLNPLLRGGGEALFMDDCHLTDRGNAAAAEALRPFLERAAAGAGARSGQKLM